MLRSALIRFAFATFTRLAPALCGGAMLLPLCACSEGENDPCQVDGDCDTGLICLRAPRSDRGTCENPKSLADASVAGSDAGEGPLPDAGAGVEDAGSEDAGGTGPASSEDAG